jgi:hypothetical protein
MATTPGVAAFGIMDYNKESTKFQVHTAEITAANFAAQLILFDNLKAATGNIILGTVTDGRLTSPIVAYSNTPPSDKNAQRERKWVVRYEDATQYLDAPTNTINNPGYRKEFSTEIGTADLTKLTGRSDTIAADDPGLDADMLAFITAFEAFVKSPYTGAANILEFVAVGRNL